MKELRLWISLLALVSFLAGGAGGVLVADEILPPPPERGPFADYADHLVAQYDLGPERADYLRLLLREYHRDLEAVRARQLEAIETDLVATGDQYQSYIRDYVLPPDQRARFDLACAGIHPSTPLSE